MKIQAVGVLCLVLIALLAPATKAEEVNEVPQQAAVAEEDSRTWTHCNLLSKYRTHDGTCNNLIFRDLGSVGQFFRRGFEGAEYERDGSPVTDRPVERVVSNRVSRNDPALEDEIPHSMFATQFAQFINHDLNNNGFDDPETLSYTDVLQVPELDDSFCYIFANPNVGNFTLINACVERGQAPRFTTKFSEKAVVRGRPEVFNYATSWLDLHLVYGPDDNIASHLRTHEDGKLLTRDYIDVTTSPSQVFNLFQFGPGNTEPYSCINCLPSWGQLDGQVPVPPLQDPSKVVNFQYDPNKIFVAGDVRVGENAALSMFQTLFMRNHNWHAARIREEHRWMSDEEVYQRARRLNIAEYQNIVMYQYFPTEFGEYFADKLGRYHRYDPFLDADTAVVFATAAFRYGHSTFRNYQAVDQCGVPTMFNLPAGGQRLVFGGTTGGPILPLDVYGEIGSWENVIRGLITTVNGPNDVMIDSALRDLPFFFGAPGGTDIFVLDLHRARENGVPNYVTLQKVYGDRSDRIYGSRGCPERFERNHQTDPVECFERLVGDNSSLASNLRDLYGKVNRIDPLLGLLAEKHVHGTSFGETMGNIITDTYRRVRDGDRFWFENRLQPMPFKSRELDDIREVGMADLLRRNFDFPSHAQVPANPFLTPPFYGNTLGQTEGCTAPPA